MIGSILGVVFDNKDQGVILVFAGRDLLDDLPQGVIVVGHLRFNRIDAVNGAAIRTGVAKVVVGQSNQLKIRQRARCRIGVEFARPLLFEPVVCNGHIPTAIVGIRMGLERRFRGPRHDRPSRIGFAQHR
jgi:hypothetical protein